jgi:hypothetical protein
MHYPPGTSTGNKIEHRLFSFISKNWQGIPLISEVVIGELISATKTDKGLTVTWVIDTRTYKTGKKVSDEEFNTITIRTNTFHGEWNYTTFPTTL